MELLDRALEFVGIRGSKIAQPGMAGELEAQIGLLQADVMDIDRQIKELDALKKEAQDIIDTLTARFDQEKSSANRKKIRETILQTAGKVRRADNKIAAKQKEKERILAKIAALQAKLDEVRKKPKQRASA
jgi:chromosome segregation ATPase